MDSVWWLFLVCAVVLCTAMAGATDAPLEQGRINQLSVYLSEKYIPHNVLQPSSGVL